VTRFINLNVFIVWAVCCALVMMLSSQGLWSTGELILTRKAVFKEKPVPGLCDERTTKCLTSFIICMLKVLMLCHMISSLTHFYL